jgi:gliding motility-associated-like protein
MVKTVKDVQVYVPTAFTPNQDGLNDVLRPVLMGIKEIRYFRIFNRWGQLIFETKTDRHGWDGTINGTQVSSQAVVWMLEGIGVNNVMYRRKGTSVLIR